MANSEHEKLAKQGVEAIRKWRLENPKVILNLAFADLEGLDLSNVDLTNSWLHDANFCKVKLMNTVFRKVDLSRVDFTSSDLSNADLSETALFSSVFDESNLQKAKFAKAQIISSRFRGSNLKEGDLTDADVLISYFLRCDLAETNFSRSNLGGSDFIGSKLIRTNFSEADFNFVRVAGCKIDQANFTNVKMAFTSMQNLDLGKIIGLSTITHEAPSSIDFMTLTKSFTNAECEFTPEMQAFLVNAGVQKELLDQLPKILAKVKYCTCFICYGKPDLKFATKLVEDLRGRGVSCWLYDLDATVGKRTWEEITTKRREAEKMIVLCSIKALMREGVKKEIEEQIDENPDKIVPISLDDDWKHDGFQVKRGARDLKAFLIERNYADFGISNYKESLGKLLKGIEVKRP